MWVDSGTRMWVKKRTGKLLLDHQMQGLELWILDILLP